MANIVLRANIADANVNVEYKVLPLPLISNEVELTISPVQGTSINSKNYSYGVLPAQINSISFKQLGTNVVARINLSENINPKKTQNIRVPIISISTIIVDRFKLTDSTSLNTNDIVTTESSEYREASLLNEKIYSGTNTIGKKILILSKTVIATNKQYFAREPNYSITGDESRYSSVDTFKTDIAGNIVSKKFDIYYTSPSIIDNIVTNNTISFNGVIAKLTEPIEIEEVFKKEDYKIYSFDKGTSTSKNGGRRAMSIKGVPGTMFKLLIQDTDKKTYNFKTGVMEVGGGILEGKIPLPRGRRAYGEYVAYANIPRTAVDSDLTINLTVDKPFDHAKLKGGPANLTQSDLISITSKEKIQAGSSITFSLFSSGFTIPLTNTKGTANLIVGPGKFRDIGNDAKFSVTLTAATNQIIRIERQPLHSETEAYVNWDSGSNKSKALTSAGVVIPNDWQVADDKNALLSIDTKCTGVGLGKYTVGEITYTDGYTEVKIEATISNVRFGTEDITLSLDLLNFLTLQALS